MTACADPDAFVCRDHAGTVQALFWDFTITHPGPSVINQEYYKAEHPAKSKEAAELHLTGLKPGTYRLTATKVGYRANDVQSAWRDLGSPSQLTRVQVQTLSKASAGEPISTEKINVPADGVFSRHFEMRENDVWLVELHPL